MKYATIEILRDIEAHWGCGTFGGKPGGKYLDNIARKVAEEPMEDIDDRAQHIIDEERGDMIREYMKEQAQREMYDDPYLNWSGLR
jgi:hypothetical protein